MSDTNWPELPNKNARSVKFWISHDAAQQRYILQIRQFILTH